MLVDVENCHRSLSRRPVEPETKEQILIQYDVPPNNTIATVSAVRRRPPVDGRRRR